MYHVVCTPNTEFLYDGWLGHLPPPALATSYLSFTVHFSKIDSEAIFKCLIMFFITSTN